MQSEVSPSLSVLLVEAFYGGSHKQLIDLLKENIDGCCVFTLPAKKWHWRARTAALHFSQTIPSCPSYRVLFSSSVLNLCELVALRPDLARLKKVLYFHENQLVYPVRKDQERDFQYGYNQVLSWLLPKHKLLRRTANVDDQKPVSDQDPHQPISGPTTDPHQPTSGPTTDPHQPTSGPTTDPHQPTSGPTTDPHQPTSGPTTDPHQPTSGPTTDPHQSTSEPRTDQDPAGEAADQVKPLHIVWPHRWEHDKNPELFFNTLLKLKERRLDFHLSVLGETFTDVPEIFSEARRLLDSHILNWGYLPSKDDYLQVLCQADVVVSTANHEFFGVAMLEAVHCGCYPLCPKALVYPEIFPAQYLYSTPEQLCKRLQGLCRRPDVARRHVVAVDTCSYSWAALKSRFQTLLADEGP
ncbi:glycosyltransferase-like domain-containing protein 1 isoform X2 [Acanthochromis polyacanthus]|uniref:glycosyltransferase-like domain-containing protein 1 isoform X2 n=1 Tax=Acanthochromis polyacanthus TaxID=80966 RepID=UPI002233EDED|nr:glycosyltransferase-like domain-containing protein 1 isoform X2 [Acanthochromis polyacanthus]